MACYLPSSRNLVYDLCWALGKSVLLGNCHQMEISVYAMNWKWLCLLNWGRGRGAVKADAVIVSCVLLTLRYVRE